MRKILAVCWDAELLRFVLGKAVKDGQLQIIEAGERSLTLKEDGTAASPADAVINLVKELKATKATLVMCLNRGSVDSVKMEVPPASDAELPTIVHNLIQRQISGISEESTIDYVVESENPNEARTVLAMVLPLDSQHLIQKMNAESGCSTSRAVVITHPLRIFASHRSEEEASSTLIICKGGNQAHLLVTKSGLPTLSRTIRLASEMKPFEESQFIASELQRTLLSGSNQSSILDEISEVLVIGSEIEAAPLVDLLQDRFSGQVQRVSAQTIVDGVLGTAAGSVYSPLLAALKEEALAIRPAVDFIHPKRPPKPMNRRNRILAIAASTAILVGIGWFYVHSQFAEVKARNVELKKLLAERDELARKGRNKRNLEKLLNAWEAKRMNWIDELRDLTIRMPSSPELVVQQFSGGSSGASYVISFNGTTSSPEVIRKMEQQLRDKYHEPKTPGIREVRSGEKSFWSFQTTMRLSSRSKDLYQLKHNATTKISIPQAKEGK